VENNSCKAGRTFHHTTITGFKIQDGIINHFSQRKKLSADKPDSVVPVKPGWPSFILPQHCCCDLAAYPPTLPAGPGLNGPLSGAGVHGITAHKVYPLLRLPAIIVSAYLTFSPLSRCFHQDGYFLWHLLFLR
jgi:hypothetical protein